MKGHSVVASWFTERLHDQVVLLRLLVYLLALIAMLVIVEGWRPSFRYRIGDRPSRGLVAEVAFRRVDRVGTERARSKSLELIPYYFSHDPRSLDSLPAKLRSHLSDIADAAAVDVLATDTRDGFGLLEREDQQGQSSEFDTLKSAVSTGGGSVGNRIDDLVDDFQLFMSVIQEYGILDEDELVRNEIAADANLTVLDVKGVELRKTVVAEVRPSELIKDTGQLGKSWALYPKLAQIRPMLEKWILSQTPGTLKFNADQTSQARLAVLDSVVEYDFYSLGDVLVEPGQVIDEPTLAVLQAEFAEVQRSVSFEQRLLRVLTVMVMFVVLGVLFAHYVYKNEPVLAHSVWRQAILLTAFVVTVALARWLSFDPWRAEIVPLLATVMVIAIAYNQVLATIAAFALTLIISLSTVNNLEHFVVLMSVSTSCAIPLARVPSRSTVIKVGFLGAVVFFIVSWGTGIIHSSSPSQVWTDSAVLMNSLKGAGWCLVAGYLVAGSLPFVEAVFGMVTDISLLEMSDISHPLLQELVRSAPGTYNHSIAVATIGEAAADRIGANGLLVRVAAYFHDIGKMLKPDYFIENVADGMDSRHEHLAPAMSTLIIIGHVKDGVDLARQYNLPPLMVDFIEQHHGTTLVEYFYHEATRQADQQPDHKTDAEESLFRYPGPKPQSREAGVMMLADAVESASRTLSEPTPKRIGTLVHKVTLKRLLDGQFNESSLTLNEIRLIEESLIKSLIGIYHGRIKYLEQRSA
ncbi:MAG: HDIG domain-containing metalloprotein [Planctomycetaceae bacterium]